MLQSILGLAVLVTLAWVLSEGKKKVSLKLILMGIGLQFILAFMLLKISFFREIFLSVNYLIQVVQEATQAGTSLVFGYVGGGELPFDEKYPGSSFVLAFQALPLILVISALSSLFFFWGILPKIVRAFSWALEKTLKISGSEGLGVAANVFVGMVEAPLMIRPYLAKMTRSELFTLMTCGMATIAGTVMVLYASILSRLIPDVTAHLIIASIISAPAAVVISKVMVPETQEKTTADMKVSFETQTAMGAIMEGTMQGINLLINITAMIIVLVALVSLANSILSLLPEIAGQKITLQLLMGYIMAPITWLMGIPWSESIAAGSLMGIKTVLNELIAYIHLSNMEPGTLSRKSSIIMIYAMCGFANPGSLGIMVGGMSAMAPERKQEILSLGTRSIIGGTLATCMTGAVISLFL